MPAVHDPIIATERAISQFQRFTDDPWGEHLVTGLIGGVLLWAEYNLALNEEARDERVKRLLAEGGEQYRAMRKAHLGPGRMLRRRPRERRIEFSAPVVMPVWEPDQEGGMLDGEASEEPRGRRAEWIVMDEMPQDVPASRFEDQMRAMRDVLRMSDPVAGTVGETEEVDEYDPEHHHYDE